LARVKQLSSGSLWQIQEPVSPAQQIGASCAADEIAAQIEKMIISKDLAEGVRLPSERDFAEIHSTSRPTVSQAIRILVVKGLVETRRGSGAYVTRRPQESLAASVNLIRDLNRESVPHLNDLRLWLETVGIQQAIERGTETEIAEGERALQQMQESTGDTAAWMSADTHFHATLVRASHNPYLASIYESVHTALISYEYRNWIAKGTVPKWLNKNQVYGVTAIHEPILDAVKKRDEEAGRTAVLHHHYIMAQHLAASHR
jgi:GntR family transcriptional repressor for pyruvate dehydrogenase complex